MKTYIKPIIVCTAVSTESFIAASPVYNPNQVTPNGNSTGTGGYSQPSDEKDNGNGSISDMSKHYVPWTSWDDFDL